jgi:serine/threonine-protein kinase
LAQTAPTTDNARVTSFLQQLFGDEIDEERRARQELLDRVAAGRIRSLISGGEESRPETVTLTPKDPPPPTGIIGTYLDGRYLVKGLMGEGGMGMVYEAEHVEIGRRVAVKVLHERFSRQAEVVARFRSEARAATRIGHPHIIDVFDSGTTVDGAVYFVMEYLQGRDLSHVIDNDGLLGIERALSITRQICLALAAAHKAGILHRDIKPENVFLVEREGSRDFVKVLDFGIAKSLDEANQKHGRLTNPGIAMGTPEYMAPEQASGQLIDGRADVYAVGAILYEMLTGKPPHDGVNVLEILTRKATQPPLPPSRLRPEVSRELERLVMRTLAVSPAARPQSMDILLGEIDELTGTARASRSQRTRVSQPGPTIEQAAIGTDRLPRQRGRYVLAGMAAASLVVGGTAWLVGRMATPPAPLAAPTAPPAAATTAVGGVAAHVEGSAPLAPPAPAANQRQARQAPDPASAAPSQRPAPPGAPAESAPRAAVERGMASRGASRGSKSAASPKSSAPTASAASGAQAEARQLLKEAHDAQIGGRFAQATELYERVRASGLERAAAATGLAEVAFQRGNFADAVRLAQHAVEVGGAVGAKLVLGNAYFKLGKYAEAIQQYRAVLALDAHNAEARAFLEAAQKRHPSN